MLQLIMGAWPTILAGLAGLFGLLALVLGIRKSGSDAQKVKDQEVQLEQAEDVTEAIVDAHESGERTADDLRNHPDRLREDDGHKRGVDRSRTKSV